MKYIKIITLILVFLTISTVITSKWIAHKANGKTFDTIEQIPKNKVGLVLGTIKSLSNGQTNLYYTYRINAAVALYEAGKIDFVLISGDNGSKSYDEPSDFKNDLIERGIPEEKIFLDYAGFRTLDSVIRAKEIFGQNSITIISQKFHNERAIYLAEHYGIDAVAFNAKDVPGAYGLKTQLREYLARANASIDVVINTKPKFLGEKIIID
ncbi:YdcF family protein [Subsaxibacter sp. CAU 1640]|uniref:SanA/YdcF family protein n=1 Tax=Subsaxibacter sp. CAU 1640 TaxID=2933271 RepID=UPI002004FD1E|nr:ElyC/SanA/YdcF family protein [Subsaxibacter sp. CAU 1640]MCK7591487.1 YdcF family protein [Subsaxibacter sp. CAU 1640]